MIDIDRMDSTHFIIVTAWCHGFSAGQIAKGFDVPRGWVTSAIRSKENGGFLPNSRDHLTTEDRQNLLDYLKANRIDRGGKMPNWIFRAISLDTKQSTTPARIAVSCLNRRSLSQ